MMPVVVPEQLVIKLAARIKAPKAWPEKPSVYEIDGFRVSVGTTPEKKFRRVVVTHPQVKDFVLALIDANPAKVRDAKHKVMVYLTTTNRLSGWGVVQKKYVGQARLAPEPKLVWFDSD